ncbi:protein kinase domain-containing protein [Persicimonas caeni]|nr:protein kinase [Persicimonas caeni]
MAEQDPLIGRKLGGNLRIDRLLGRGGMGAVYVCVQESLGRELAVKVMTPEHAQNPVAPEYFLREARSASGLRHPNIIQIYDFGEEDDGTLYIAMELVPGQPLTDVIKDEFPLPAERVVGILDQTLAALEEAHANQIIHRDLKPDNLMVEETRAGGDFVKVLDFGIAKPKGVDAEAGPLTRQGAILGTPEFMSPEQARGQAVDARTDLFAIGVILYNMLTDRLPITGKSLTEMLINLIQQEPLAPSAARTDLSIHPGLEAICLRAIKKDPDLRYQSAADFRRALEAALDDAPAPEPSKDAPPMFVFRKPGKSAEQPPEQSSKPQPEPKPEPPADPPSEKESKQTAVLTDDTSRHTEKIASQPTQLQVKKPEADDKQPDDKQPDDKQTKVTRALGVDVEGLREDLLGEQRFATVLVAHQRASRKIDAREQAELREAVHDAAGELAAEFGATVGTRRGNCQPILFGLDEADGADATKAIEMALDLRRRLRHVAPPGITFSYALAQGSLYAPSGSQLARFGGEPLDDATELARMADDEAVLVADAALDDTLRDTYEFGVTRELDGAPVLGRHSMRGHLARGPADLIGRDDELAKLLAELAHVARGSGRLFGLVGEAGMGKSALLAEFARLARQRGYEVLGARHHRPGAEGVRDLHLQWLEAFAFAYGGAGGAGEDGEVDLDALLERKGVSAEARRALTAFYRGRLDECFGGGAGGAAALGEGQASAEAAVQAAFRQLVDRLAAAQPVVLIVDGVDGVDPALAKMYEEWALFSADRAVLFATAMRTVAGKERDALPDTASVVEIGPLGEGAEALLRAAAPAGTPQPTLDALLELAGGIPLYLEQLGRQLHTADDVDPNNLDAWLAKVDTLGGALRARLFAQPKAVRNVLGLLAIAGSGTSAHELDAMAPSKWAVDEALQYLYDEGLIRAVGEDARLYFDPPIFERVVYEQLSPKRRRRAHANAAAHFAKLAEHAQQADDAGRARRYELQLARQLEACESYERAFGVYRRLADDALAGFAFESAEQFLSKLLDVATHRPDVSRAERATLELELARVERGLGNVDEALDLVRTVYRDRGLDAQLQHEAGLELADLWLGSEDTARVETMVEGLVQKLRDGGEAFAPWLLLRALQVLGAAREKRGNLTGAADALLEAVERAQRTADVSQSPWRQRLVWEPLNQLGRIRLRLEQTDGAEELFEQARQVAAEANDRRGEVTALANLSTAKAATGSFEQAFDHMGRALELAADIADLPALAKLWHNLGLLYARQRRWEEARDAFNESLERARATGWREGIALNSEQLRRTAES